MAEKSDDDRSVVPPAKTPRTIFSRDLLKGERLVIVRHERETYRLQLTAAGKLILTK